VGPGRLYDVIGASQLDFGCGSLRGGRFFISYLQAGHYYGVEPNQWLVQEALREELGEDILTVKSPHFSAADDFSVPFDVRFDVIVALSIFTHTGKDIMRRLFATFFVGDADETRSGWFYFDNFPKGESVLAAYTEPTIRAFAADAGLHARRIHFWHPANQQWFLFSPSQQALPTPEQEARFTGLNILPPLP
jgi:hypothetical protein